MTRVLVTGSSGFIGRHVVTRLQSDGLDVTGLDRRTGHNSGDFIHKDLLDLREDFPLHHRLKSFTHVIHLAAEAYVPTSVTHPDRYVQNNVIGTTNLIEVLAAAPHVTRFLLVSSCEVYGTTSLPVDESAAPRPASPYAASKLSQEAFCQAAARCWGLPLVTARLFNNYGPGQQPDRLIPALIRACTEGTEFSMTSDGSQTRDWVHVRDTADALARLLFADDVQGGIYNVCAENEVSVHEICRLVFSHVEEPPKVVRASAIEGHLRRSAGIGRKLRKATGWTPSGSLDGHLKEAFTY
ncbi:dTDP-glucose 4,6-dehydratase [Actinomadura luteofluorescens]|uniref:NAD-dependent epimerase/dehydratase family protein n=1 Tax=Actinomadura luteofluorescens TaxID=46163 RepID=UPI0021641BB0|nr:NAD-dependent epimerase/dehydratase family protein [Actinomadura glauciflava]MCR3743489.1 dTDP-glucose 4,6-dehydratase [Actinomadura glauciflava]